LNIDDTRINEAATRLVGLEGVSVTQVKDDGTGGPSVYVVTSEDSARACPGCGVFSTRLKDYPAYVADHAHLPELVTLAETVEQWWDGIETYLTTGITNAASEGNNRLIKLEARNAFGFRNRENQRLRSRCATTRRSRREAHP
jgi:transposase